VLYAISGGIRFRYSDLRTAHASLASLCTESLSAIFTLKAFNAEASTMVRIKIAISAIVIAGKKSVPT